MKLKYSPSMVMENNAIEPTNAPISITHFPNPLSINFPIKGAEIAETNMAKEKPSVNSALDHRRLFSQVTKNAANT